jgi:transcription elongation factor Elf1
MRNSGEISSILPVRERYIMFEKFFSRDSGGTVKGLTLEWKCPDCAGLNFRILGRDDRAAGAYSTHCRYCQAKFRILFERPGHPVEGEDAFMDQLDAEDFSRDERTDMIRDFAEIAALKADNALPRTIKEKEKALEIKMDFTRRRRR